ncbi:MULTISPECIES: phage tail protein [Acinetobacter]|uniref:Oxidoreductase n=1 Tax=Acinetobacter ursingii TaxID=108980 RepID=A0A3D2SM57_9GAMM|nr:MULTISPECIES: phage tail protein [Acinetobacter]RSC23241.1 phage tail protein [Acinetobacter sp. FDAARGOS_515]VTX86000.1 Phage P2 GpU [Acinetobacter ursingii]HCK29794.1 oxidoreductase [Acinetobacter ursingii]
MMMALGLFVFSLRTTSYQELQRVTNWRHPSNSRVGATPAYQFTGKGEDTITLKGVIYHEITQSRVTLDQIRKMADTGKAYTLIEGTGKIYGLVIIDSLDETKTFFFKDGAARKTEFTITLKVIKEWQPTLLGSLIGMAAGALNRLI